MNKAELARIVSEKVGIHQRLADRIVEVILQAIRDDNSDRNTDDLVATSVETEAKHEGD